MTWKLKVDIATVSEGLKISLPEDAMQLKVNFRTNFRLMFVLCFTRGDNVQNDAAHQIQQYSQTYFWLKLFETPWNFHNKILIDFKFI